MVLVFCVSRSLKSNQIKFILSQKARNKQPVEALKACLLRIYIIIMDDILYALLYSKHGIIVVLIRIFVVYLHTLMI